MKKWVKMILYLLPAVFSVIVVLSHISRIHISIGSAGVLFVAGIMLAMYFVYRGNDVSATGFYVVSPTADDQEERQLNHMHSFARLLLCMLPMQLIFVFLFNSDLIKGLGAVGVLFLAFFLNLAVNMIQKRKE